MHRKRSETIVVLGGGLTGLTIAQEMAAAGQKVVLLEASSQVGGDHVFFEWRGQTIDQFHHALMPSDEEFLDLLADLGLENELAWNKARIGFMAKGKPYGLDGGLDRIQFGHLSPLDRVRWATAPVLPNPLSGKGWDNTRVEDWLRRVHGANIWAQVWKPLLEARFGAAASDMPAQYAWKQLNRSIVKRKRGYIKGGMAKVFRALEAKLRRFKVDIRTNCIVDQIDEFDGGISIRLKDGAEIRAEWCISTLPPATLKRALSRSGLSHQIRVPDLDYRGTISTTLLFRKPLETCYWTPVVDSGVEFDEILNVTELVDRTYFAGHFAVNLVKYCDSKSPLYDEPDEQIAARWRDQLLALFPGADLVQQDIADTFVFKATDVEPVYPPGYSRMNPRITDGQTRLLLATSAQKYPRSTSWNASVALAHQVVRKLRQRMRREEPTYGRSKGRAA